MHNTINLEGNQAITDVDSIFDELGKHNERSVFSVARAYVQAGISLIPCGRNKKPMFSLLRMANGQSGWVQYQKRLPTEEELIAWFSLEGGANNLGVVCGNISGGLEVLDFDRKLSKDGEYINVFEDFKLKLESRDLNLLERLVVTETKNGGVHVKYRCTAIEGNQVLARCLKDDGTGLEAIIETRGEGGYVVSPPSNGYGNIQGGLLEVQQITPEERQILFDLAKTFDRAPKRDKYLPANSKSADGEEQISEWYGRVHLDQWRVLITREGWTLATTGDDGIEHWTRSGKDPAAGSSATWSMKENRGGVAARRFYVFSANAYPFENAKSYSPFQIYCLLEHGGDWNAAVAEVGKMKREQELGQIVSLPVEFGEGALSKVRRAGNVVETESNSYVVRLKARTGEFYDKVISNFTIYPKQRILAEGKEDVVCDFLTSNKIFHDIHIPRDCWNSKKKFMNVAPSIDLSWVGSEDDVQFVQQIVSSYDVPTKIGTKQLGLQSGVWVA